MQKNDFHAETICGYEVSSNRKRLWHCELKMLEFVEKICKDNGLDYFLLYGSAIGAVRHKGFIPWDDDIDIGMIREDFDRFIRIVGNCIDDNYEVQYGYRKPIYDFILRIRDKNTTGITYQEVSAEGCKGAFIEIYPFDHVNNNLMRKMQISINTIIYKLLILKSQEISSKKGLKKIERILVEIIPGTFLWKTYSSICQIQNKRDAEYIDLISVPTYAKRNWGLMKFQDVAKTITVPFEYIKTRVPENYDNLLRNTYGDYMKLPPIEERGKFHENIVFYDPNVSYTYYEGSKIIKDFFKDSSIHDKI